MLYDVCDDYGIWVVTEGVRYLTEEAAQDECNRRNHKEGSADVNGELKSVMTEADEDLWRKYHLTHSDCTCQKKSVGQVNRELAN